MNAIRPYRPADRDALYAICIRTGDAGRDATALYRDPRILPDIFTGLRVHLTGYPAHLHIALAPQVQGKGAGRALMGAYLKALRAAGVPRVHLSMSAANTGARAFYDRLGFHQIARPKPTRVLLGRLTHPLPP